jgi:hypothetical protein
MNQLGLQLLQPGFGLLTVGYIAYEPGKEPPLA